MMNSEPSVFVHYDPDVDALYVDLETRSDGDVHRTVELDASRLIDYDAAGQVLGVEFLGASDGINLDGVPHAEAIRGALKAFPALNAA
jgi:uncharacterized protein YuzE